jgi:hypothetical protein
MPIYTTPIRGDDKPRLVRADTPAAARSHIVTAESITTDEMADLMAAGATIEVAEKPAAAPASAD